MTRTLAILSLLLLPAAAFAGHGEHSECDHPTRPEHAAHGETGGFKMHETVFRMIAEHGDDLGIDERTQKKIRSLVDSHRETMEELQSGLKEAYSGLHEMMEASKNDLEETLAQADQVATLKGEMFKQQIRTMVELKQHLTEEQIEEIHETVKKRMHRRKHHGGERSHHDGERAHGEHD